MSRSESVHAPAGAGASLDSLRARLLEQLALDTPGGELAARYTDAIRTWIGEFSARQIAAAGDRFGPLAVVAQGGLGRGELCPFSDVDLAVLCALDPGADPGFEEWMRGLLHPLWDAGLNVNAVVHDVDGWLTAAVDDLPLCTSLLDVGWVAGDAALVDRLREQGRERFFGEARGAFLQRLRAEVKARHERYGSTVYRVEPDLKYGPGGARDLAVIEWALLATHETADFCELEARGVLTASAAELLGRARDVILRLRTALHLAAGRTQDRLVFRYQEGIPVILGMVPPGEVPDEQLVEAIETFMQDYYRAALDVHRQGRRVVARCLPPKQGAQVEQRIDEDFRLIDHRLHHHGVDPFEGRPILALAAVATARDQQASLSAQTMDCAAEAVASESAASLADDPEAQAMFLDLLVDPSHHGLPTPLELAHELGVVDRLVPEFAASRGRMQHDSFHVYTVDRHSLYAVEFLKSIARGEYRKDYPMATALHLGLSDLVPLYLSALLHDAGKAFGDQCEEGAKIARRAARRAQLDEEDVERCALLVREHLTMPLLSQKRDLGDPLLIDEFAALVGDKRTLDELYLLSMADMAAVSPDYLNSWKVTLLDELYLLTAAVLAKRAHQATTRRLRADEPEGLPRRYYSLFDVERRRIHRQLIDRLRTSGALALVDAGEGAGGAMRMTIVARDRRGLLAHLTAELDEYRLPVVAADIFSVPGAPAVALDVFRLMPDAPSDLAWDDWQGRFEQDLCTRLADPEADAHLVREPDPLPRVRGGGRRPVPTKVAFSEDPAGRRTIVEIETADQPSVLRRITAAFASLGLDIEVARVSTEARRVHDTFYVARLDKKEREKLARTVQTFLRRR